jgi:hypothetical protein
MRAYDYILSKQILWALNNEIPLVGSKGNRGRLSYTKELSQNIFEPLNPGVHESFLSGDGNEILGDASSPAKMQAVHSSSALSVNVFQYWQTINQIETMAATCKFCRRGNNTSKKIVFEDKYPIDDKFKFSPNIDVVFHNSDSSKYKRFAVECKFSEAYRSRGHSGLKSKYLKLSTQWNGIPAVHELAKTICPNDNFFTYLHAAQLIKHILGLKSEFGKNGFRIMYLWYDVLGHEGAAHRDEVSAFADIILSDGIKFHSMTYQELILNLSNQHKLEHRRYTKYLTERYL